MRPTGNRSPLATERRLAPRIAVAASFVVLGLIGAGFVYALVLGDEARDEAPELRNDIVVAVRQAVRSGDLSVDAYRASTLLFLDDRVAVPQLLPEVPGAQIRRTGLGGDDRTLEFTYAGDSRAPGYCFPGSLGADGLVRVEFTLC